MTDTQLRSCKLAILGLLMMFASSLLQFFAALAERYMMMKVMAAIGLTGVVLFVISYIFYATEKK